ncbi:MAG: acyloxyacyl hydrolase [Pseudomonadota bacterium]|nr:acyloxyacyl hydrolase [Pseudomonadota bacterium]
MTRLTLLLCVGVWAVMPSTASASEIFGGIYVHDVKTPLNLSGVEEGLDLQLGWRGGRIGATPLQPYIFGAVNSARETHYGAIGLSAKFGDRLFIRPGLGLALHTGSSSKFQHPDHDHIDFGSRVLFAPEVGVGVRVTDRMTIEGSLVHMSHGILFSRQNPGTDNIGVRLTLDLP